MTRTTTRHTIAYQTGGAYGLTRLEAVGSGVILPGHLLAPQSGGKVDQHGTQGAATTKLVALENQTPDTHTYPQTASIDIPYIDGDTVYYAQARPGDVLNMFLKSGESVTKGIDWLASDGAGRLISVGTGISVGTSNPVGLAWETVNASGSAYRCLVRIT